MMQTVAGPSLLTSVPTIDEVLQDHASELGHDFIAYRNPVANQLTPVWEALTGVADSLAAHFAEWGAVSRFSALPSPATSKRDQKGVPSMQQISFDKHIKAMFRRRDQQSMQFAFDLWSYDDVAAHADDILARVRAGTMPCDGAWPKEQVDAFQNWVDAGKPR